MDNIDYKLEYLIDIPLLQDLQEKLNEVYSFPSAIIDNEGKILTAVAWQDICTKFHRKHPVCEKECIKSDQYILEHLHEANPAVSYLCPHGLVDNATPIIIDGKHLGNFFTGQFFLEKPDMDFFREQAKKYNFNENEYLEAVAKVPVWTKQKVSVYLNFIKGFIQIIAGIGLKNLREKEINLKLFEQEELYRTILKTASDGFWLVNMQGQLLEVNDAYCTMSGYSENELLLMKISDFEVIETPDTIEKHFEIILDKGEDRFITKHRRKDGTIFDVEVNVQYIKNNNNLFVAFLRDVTDRLKNEKELIRAKELAEENEKRIKLQNEEITYNNDRLESLLRISQISTTSNQELLDCALHEAVTLTKSKIGYIYFYNSEKKQFILNTWSKEVMKECAILDAQTIYDLDKTGCWGEAVRQRKPVIINDYQAENPLKKGLPEGHVKLIKFLTIPVFSQGEIVAVAGVANKETDYDNTDVRQLTLLMDNVWKISERILLMNDLRVAKEIAEESEARYKALHNASFGGITIHDKGLILDCNKGLSEITGYSYQELVGMDGLQLIAERYREFVMNKIISGYEEPYEAVGLRKNGEEYPLRLEARNIPYKGKQVRSVEFRDISKQKNIEKELIAAKEHAEQSDRLKTAFLQNMSHEIRTPMNAIMGFSELLVRNFNDKSKLDYFSNIINQRCSDLLVIIDDILDISKIESGQLSVNIEPCNLNSLFAEIRLFFAEHQQKIGKQHINFIFQAHGDPARLNIVTDRVKLKQIFINLIGNAFKFTDKGQIEGGCRFDDSNNIIFYVSDTGIGIPAEKQDAIFERFVQLEPSPNRLYGGTGLGLSIVKGLVSLLNGKIWLESEPGTGTTFFVSLPCIIQNDNSTIAINEQFEPTENNYRQKTILVVEDDTYNAAFINEVLLEMQVKTIFVQYGNEAIDVALKQPIDIILMDIGLPDITGYEATRKIKLHKPDIKIIAQTAFAANEDKRKAIEAGCIDYISKPIKSKMLLSIINKHLS